jgi:hypothetical protein
MKKVILFGALFALLFGCNTATTQNTTEIKKEVVEETTVRYFDALPAEFNEDDMFGLILDYGGYSMIVNAWQMPDGDWLIPYHWCEEEDGGGVYFKVDEQGNEVEVVYKDPFEGKPYPVIHNPQFSFSTRNYGGQTINFYKASDSQEVACSTDYKEISLDVVGVDLKTRRLLVQSNPKDWCWGEPEEEWQEEYRHPFVELRGWIDEEWVCANTVTTCP